MPRKLVLCGFILQGFVSELSRPIESLHCLDRLPAETADSVIKDQVHRSQSPRSHPASAFPGSAICSTPVNQ